MSLIYKNDYFEFQRDCRMNKIKVVHYRKVSVVCKSNGSFDQARKRVSDLTPKECTLVFDDTRLRSADEQIKLLREQKKRRVTISARVSPGAEDLEQSNEGVLEQHLRKAHEHLLEARTCLAMQKPDNPLDVHIANALREIGGLRFKIHDQT